MSGGGRYIDWTWLPTDKNAIVSNTTAIIAAQGSPILLNGTLAESNGADFGKMGFMRYVSLVSTINNLTGLTFYVEGMSDGRRITESINGGIVNAVVKTKNMFTKVFSVKCSTELTGNRYISIGMDVGAFLPIGMSLFPLSSMDTALNIIVIDAGNSKIEYNVYQSAFEKGTMSYDQYFPYCTLVNGEDDGVPLKKTFSYDSDNLVKFYLVVVNKDNDGTVFTKARLSFLQPAGA